MLFCHTSCGHRVLPDCGSIHRCNMQLWQRRYLPLAVVIANEVLCMLLCSLCCCRLLAGATHSLSQPDAPQGHDRSCLIHCLWHNPAAGITAGHSGSHTAPPLPGGLPRQPGWRALGGRGRAPPGPLVLQGAPPCRCGYALKSIEATQASSKRRAKTAPNSRQHSLRRPGDS
jgi:hypothetical protein